MMKLSLLMASAAIILVGCGGKDEAAAPEVVDQATQVTAAEVETVVAPATEAVAAVAEEPDLAQGKQIYSKNCFACHGSGAAGAPKLGDAGNWEPRIAKGMDTLAQNAIDGFKGAAGYMPPKGGFMALSDADVAAAVAYMVSESR